MWRGIRSAPLAIILFAAIPAAAADLRVVVTGLRNDDGLVRVALYDRPDAFPDRPGIHRDAAVAPSGGRAEARFDGLAPGRYAIAVHHDENADDIFDKVLFLPAEGYGFGNDAPVFLGPPAFDAAAVAVGVDGARAEVHIRY